MKEFVSHSGRDLGEDNSHSPESQLTLHQRLHLCRYEALALLRRGSTRNSYIFRQVNTYKMIAPAPIQQSS